MIAIDAVSQGAASSSSPITWTHTCTGSDLVLIVGTIINAGSGSETVTAVTYNSVSMTQIGSALNDPSNTSNISYWYLLNPATGPNTVSVTKSSILSCNALAISLTGVSAYESVTVTNTGTTSPMNTTLTNTAYGAWIIDMFGNKAAGANTSTSTGIQGTQQQASSGSNGLLTCSTFGPILGASDKTRFSYSATGTSFQLTHRMASFSPVATLPVGFKKNGLRPRPFAPGVPR